MDALAQVLQAMNQLLQDLAQQVQAQNQPPPQAAPPAAFNLTPLGATPQGQLIEYTSKEGKKFYSMATRPLFPKDEHFDVEPNKFRTFMTLLAGRCKDLGFTGAVGICMVPPDAAQPDVGERINTVEDFGRASMEQIRAWETMFLAADAGANGRRAQESKMLCDTLMNSLSTQGTARIELWKHQCSIAAGPNNVACDLGGCLLKVIMRESYLDSNATVSTIPTSFTWSPQ